MAGVIDPFIDIAWVREHRDAIVFADVRWYIDGRSGRDAYAAGHIPGGVFVDLETALSRHADPATAGRHPLADPAEFAAAMGALGIGDGDTVVAYDDAGGVMAARLVWMLRVSGHEAALLDGGLAAWEGGLEAGPAERSLAVGETSRPAADFAACEFPAESLATIEETASAAGSEAAVVIDARPRERFEGAPDHLDPRAGHIPGSRSVPCRENLDAAGRLLPVAELRTRFGIEDAAAVVSSCGSGVTACHNLLAMEQAGLGRGRLFPGSWSQWSRDPAWPVQTGADPDH
jgi:thiosulfate/3-mercaptopyruvate sulfurtransferase